jgi:hypothetical protein
MKKYYSLALALLVALGAKAATVITATCSGCRLVRSANDSAGGLHSGSP